MMPTHVEGWESKANGEVHPQLTAAWDQTDLGTSLAICQTLLEGALDQVDWEAYPYRGRFLSKGKATSLLARQPC